MRHIDSQGSDKPDGLLGAGERDVELSVAGAVVLETSGESVHLSRAEMHGDVRPLAALCLMHCHARHEPRFAETSRECDKGSDTDLLLALGEGRDAATASIAKGLPKQGKCGLGASSGAASDTFDDRSEDVGKLLSGRTPARG